MLTTESRRATDSEPTGVSIIIPAYNYARFLGCAIDSALAQTHPCCEVIVVDDGSTDNTAAVAARYGSRIRYIYQKNAGLSATRNTGIKAASYPYLAFLDADDELQPEMVSACMQAFSKLPGDYGVVASASIKLLRIDENGWLVDGGTPAHKRGGDREIKSRDLLLKNRFMPSSLIVKRSVFDDCGQFDTTLRSSEDRDMWIRVGVRYRIHLLSTPMVRIRRHSSNMSNNAVRMKKNMFRVIRKAFRDRVVPRFDFAFKLRVLSVFCFENSWMCFGENRQVDAIGFILSSLVLWPFFSDPGQFSEPRLFRIRALAHFLVHLFRTCWKTSTLENPARC